MSRRRFIAGAECAYCHVMDRIVVEVDMNGLLERRLCLACGKGEEMHETPPRDKPERNEVEVQVVRFDR